MKAQLESYFAFLLFPSKPEFLPIYWVASFLCPVYRSVITSEEMPVVRAYLEGMLTVDCWELSSLGPKPLVLKPHRPNPNQVLIKNHYQNASS